MTRGASPSSDPYFTGLGEADASRLLGLGIRGRRRPVDDVIDRLAKTDGAAWLAGVMKSDPVKRHGEAERLLLEGRATLDELLAIKEASKAFPKSAPSDGEKRRDDARLVGIAAYFVSIAAALVHHRRLICSRSHEELQPVLLDLAEAAPEPWSDLLGRAALVADPAPV